MTNPPQDTTNIRLEIDKIFENDESWRSEESRYFDPAILIPKLEHLLTKEITKARLDELQHLQGQEIQLLNSPAIKARISELKDQLGE